MARHEGFEPSPLRSHRSAQVRMSLWRIGGLLLQSTEITAMIFSSLPAAFRLSEEL